MGSVRSEAGCEVQQEQHVALVKAEHGVTWSYHSAQQVWNWCVCLCGT